MCAYAENFNKYGTPKTDNFKNNKFNKALVEAALAQKAKSKPPSQLVHLNADNLASFSTTEETAAARHQETEDEMEETCSDAQDDDITMDLETSVILAAEAGNALLAENSRLKQELHDMTLKNSQLAQHISKQNNTEQAEYEAKVEELENENEALRSRNGILVENLNDLEQQFVKEKELRNTLTQLYEEQDREKEVLIIKYEKEIAYLKERTVKLRQNHTAQTCLTKNDNKPYRDSASQTPNREPSPVQSSFSTILLEFAQLKVRQDQTEQQVKSLTEKLQGNDEDLKPATPEKKPHEEATAKVSSARQHNTSGRTSKNTKGNQFSVSLQVAKRKLTQNNISAEDPSSNKVPKPTILKRSPPMTAKIRKETETIEEFFNKNIEQATALAQTYQLPAHNYSPTLPIRPFLEVGSKVKQRERASPNTKLPQILIQ